MWKIFAALNAGLKKLWQCEYVFAGRDSYSGERWHVRLKDLIEEMFDENIRRAYKFQL